MPGEPGIEAGGTFVLPQPRDITVLRYALIGSTLGLPSIL